MNVSALMLLAGLALASEPSPLFDGAKGAQRPALPPAPKPIAGQAAKTPEPVPADLAAARSRVGNEAMIARLPQRPAGEPFAFAVIGDSERGRFWWERIFSPGKDSFVAQWRAAQDRGPAFVLQLGDFVSEANVANYRDYVRLLGAELRLPLLRCVGNHDRARPNGDADKSLYDAVFGARDYFFDQGGWRFVSLDSSDRVVTDGQLAWLRRTLAVPGPKVIFTHVPPDYLRKAKPLPQSLAAEAPEAGMQDVDAQRGGVQDFLTNYFQDGAAEFDDIVATSGVKAVYMGHIHAFWAADHRGVRYVISGGGGSPLYPLPPGYPARRFAHTLWVEAGADRLVETVVPASGAAFTLPPVAP